MKGKIWEIIRREYIERVTKKSFWIGTVLMPVFMLGSVFLPGLLVTLSLKEEIRIAVVDQSGKAFQTLKDNLERRPVEQKPDDNRESLIGKFIVEEVPAGNNLERTLDGIRERINNKQLEGCLVIGSNFDDPDCFRYYGRNVSDLNLLRSLQGALDPIVVSDRLARNNISAPLEKVRDWIRGVDLETFQVQTGGEAKKSGFGAAFLITFAFVIILYIALLIYGIANLRGVLEEKSSRIMEVLLSKFTPRQLMTGKLMGIGLVGLTQMMVYALTFGAMIVLSAMAVVTMSPRLAEGLQSVPLSAVVYFIVFFILGYFIYSAMFLGIGSLCSSEEDAQNMQSPVIMMLVIPMMSTIFFINNPDSLPAVIVSMIPVFTPMVMLMRILVLTPPLWQILLSIGLSLAFLWFLLWAVAKVFRIGVLMYGKRPSFKQVLQWFKAA
jgi:ABC-2 type transport system permease protein